MKLTDIAIKNLKPPAKGQVTYTDDTLPGFGVRVSHAGTKSFVLVHGKRRQRTTIGKYPVISLQEARGVAKTILAERTLGRHVHARSVAFEDALKVFLEDCERRVTEGTLKPRTYRDYKRLLERHFAFGKEHLRDITPDDVMRRVWKLSETPAEQHHAFSAASVFFRWAKRKRFIIHNPLEGEEVPPPPPSRTHLITDDEFVKIYRNADYYPFGAIVRLLFLLGARRTEIAHMRREWIDADERVVVIPGTLTKNKRDNVVPYGDLATELFATLPESGYLFPASRSHVKGKTTTVFNGWGKAKADLDTKCGVSGWWLHDTRRYFKSTHSALQVDDHISERLLGHITGISNMSRVYDRYEYLPEKRKAVRAYEMHLQSLLAS